MVQESPPRAPHADCMAGEQKYGREYRQLKYALLKAKTKGGNTAEVIFGTKHVNTVASLGYKPAKAF